MKKAFFTLFCAGVLFSSGVAQNINLDNDNTSDMKRFLEERLKETRERIGGFVRNTVIFWVIYYKISDQKFPK